MKKLIKKTFALLLKLILKLRYSVEVKGYDKLNPENLDKEGGVLFLPNHPALLVDPSLLTLTLFPKFPIRPLIAEYMYFKPFVYNIMKNQNAIPVPNFETSTNTLKRKRYEDVITEVSKGLKKRENFLLYPAGRLKHTNKEKVGGASGTHDIIQKTPEANIVLVRIKGLWGSSFSRALTGEVPPLFETLKKGLWTALKNLIFFIPRRKVIIEFEPAPDNFPRDAKRLEMNKWLEKYYNRPDGLTDQEGEYPGESLVLVSYSFWKKEVPEVKGPKEEKRKEVDISDIDEKVRNAIREKIHELTEVKEDEIKPQMSLSSDLGMDSLDISELAMFINDTFDTGPVPVNKLTHVDKAMAIAAKKIEVKEEKEEAAVDMKNWEFHRKQRRAKTLEGDTMIEVMLNACDKFSSSPAYADDRSGILAYSRIKLATCLLAEYIRKLPGKYIGILLPASAGAFLCAYATQLAGKVPLMINWTIGPRHIKAVKELSKVEAVLTSWAFIERLQEVDLEGIEDDLIMLETVKLEFSLLDKLRAFARSKRSANSLLKLFAADKLTKEDEAVLLFTSGTESLPKGVPLTHHNILSNQRAALETIDIYTDDVILSFLPPFHSFGFCVTGTMGLLAGLRTAFYPDPTNGKGLANSFKKWKATINCGAPTFVKSMVKAAEKGQLKTMRLCVTGAEKIPEDLINLVDEMGKKDTLIEGYGITECAPIISANRPGEQLKGVGKPLPGIEVIVVHPETHEKVPQGEEGLFLTRGPNVFGGYLNPGIESPFVTVDDKEWYNTGDMGYLDEEGRLHISGRKKRFLKVGGEMISLGAIESALVKAGEEKGWPVGQEGPALGVIGKERSGKKPELILITTFEADRDEVNKVLSEEGFSNTIKISKIVQLKEIPLMGTGKVNFRILEEKYFEGEESEKAKKEIKEVSRKKGKEEAEKAA